MKGETPNENPPKASEQQSDWDTLKQVGNEELLGKFGKHTKEYLESEYGQSELRKAKNFDRITERLFQDEVDGKISSDYRKVFEGKLKKKLDLDRQDIRHDYMEWLLNTDAEKSKDSKDESEKSDDKKLGSAALQADAGSLQKDAISEAHAKFIDKAKEQAIAKAKEQAVSKARTSEEIKTQEQEKTLKPEQARFKTKEELAKEIAKVRAELAQEKDELAKLERRGSLVAINADFTHDKKELARDYAEQELNAEVAKSNFITRLWKGDLFKKYYWKKYEKAIFSGERKVHLDGESLVLDEIIEKRSHDAIERFVMGVMDDPETSRYIHRKIGKNGENGERLTQADQETTDRIKQQIKDTIKEINTGLDEKDFIRAFKEKAKQHIAESRDKKDSKDSIALYDNYAEVAFIAYQLADHHESLDRVMEGFKVYNAEVRNNQRTKAHRDTADRIIEKFENSSIGLVVPTEAVTIAVSAASSLTKYGTALLGLGLGAASAISGLRERNRLVDERTKVMRTAAIGTPINEQLNFKGMSKKERAKYETKIGGRYYQIESASNLFSNLYDARKKHDTDAILGALAELKVRIDYSDSEQKDLIAYSSADAMGEERLALDKTILICEKELSESDKKQLATLERVIQKRIDEEVKQSDKNFNRYRLARAALRAGKTFALGAIFSLSAQEIAAAINPSKIGIFEKTGLLRTQNNAGATETLLARLAKPSSAYNGEVTNIAQGDETPYQEAGYEITKTTDGFTEVTPSRPESIDISDTLGIKDNIRWADNSTIYADGNELGLRIDQAKGAFFTNVAGNSSLSSGEVVDVAGNVANGNTSLLFKIGGKTFESSPISIDQAGQALFGQNGYITTSTGELIQVLGDNGERLFDSAQLVIRDGVGPDLTHYFTSVATIPGNGAVGDIFKATYDIIKHLPTYTATPPVF